MSLYGLVTAIVMCQQLKKLARNLHHNIIIPTPNKEGKTIFNYFSTKYLEESEKYHTFARLNSTQVR